MPEGLVRQRTHWICARCLNSARFWAGAPTRSSVPRFPSSVSHSRPSSTLAAPPGEGISITINKRANVEGEQSRRLVPRQGKPDSKNVFVDDLGATLEAHRAANKARLIRKIDRPGYGYFKRLKLPRPGTKGSARLKPNVNELEHVSPTSDLTDTTQISDPPEFPSETGLAVGAPIEAGARTSSIPPGGAWGCFWKSTSGPRFGAIQQPWLDHVKVKAIDPMPQLDEEIRAFERYITPDPEEEASVQKLIAHVKEIVAAVAPMSELDVHGSRYTKLAGPLSDIDFCLSLPEYEKKPGERGPSSFRPQAQRAAYRLLWKVQRALKPIAREGSVDFIHARVPLVAALDNVTGLSLQFSSLVPFIPAREYTMLYLSEFPSLRALYALLRHSLLIRQLTTVHNGGLGSYPLLIMIVTALKHAGTIFERNDLGRQLLHVLGFWSDADLQTNGYSADPPRVFRKFIGSARKKDLKAQSADPVLKGIDAIRKPRPSHPWLLCLQDPGTPTNDLGKNALDIEMIQAFFSQAYRSLAKNLVRCEFIAERNRASFSFLEQLVRARYDDFEARREVVREGANVTRVLPPLYKLGIKPSKEGEPHAKEAPVTSKVEEDTPSVKMTGLHIAFEEDKEQDTAGSQSESLIT